jgi:hypothetical protein
MVISAPAAGQKNGRSDSEKNLGKPNPAKPELKDED